MLLLPRDQFDALLSTAEREMEFNAFYKWHRANEDATAKLTNDRNSEYADGDCLAARWEAYQSSQHQTGRAGPAIEDASYELNSAGEEILDSRGEPVMRGRNGERAGYRESVLGADYS